jgi:hypothetical protein
VATNPRPPIENLVPIAPTTKKPLTGFATWGTGAMGVAPSGTNTPVNKTVTFNFGKGNPFGAGMILPNAGLQGYEWKVNAEQQFAVPIVLIGDKTGKYMASTLPGTAVNPGSPLTMDEALSKIMTEAIAKPGGVLALKQQLQEKQYYASTKAGQNSLAQNDGLDGYFYAALQGALNDATMYNATAAAQQGDVTNPKVLTFEDFLMQAPKTGVYDSTTSGGGSGGRQTRVTYQKFEPEDFEIAIDQMFQQTVGRGASEEELNDFVSKLQAYDKKNPQKSVSVTSGDTTKVTQSGGVSADVMQSMMRDAALDNPEAEGYNKATKYLSYFMEALDNPIELG